jgi:hypothetical protein
MDLMPYIALRDINSNALVAININTIATVVAKPQDDDRAPLKPKLYLGIRHVGEAQLTRYVPIDDNGHDDLSGTDTEAAVKAFLHEARAAERHART